MPKLVFSIIFALLSCGLFAQDGKIKMMGSDWPVFEFAKGLNATKQIPDFNYTFDKYTTCLSKMENEEIDISFMTLYDFMILSRTKPGKFKVISIIDYSSGGDAIVVRKKIENLEGLKGKSVGLDQNSISLYLLHLGLKKHNMKLSDVKIVNITAEKVDDAFRWNKRLSGVVGWNPNVATLLKKDKNSKIIYDSSNFPKDIFDLIVVRTATFDANKEAYKKLLKVWYPATKDDKVITEMAKAYKVDLAEYKTWLSDANVYSDPAEVVKLLPELKAKAKSCNEFLNNSKDEVPEKIKGLFGKKEVDIDSLFDFSLLK